MIKVLFATENESKAKRFKNELLKNNIEILYTNNVEEQIKALKAFDVNETLKVNLQNMHEAI